MCFPKKQVNQVKKFTEEAVDGVSSAFARYKKGNPLMVRKKLYVKDVFFRRDDPDEELLKLELSWDMEWYLLLAVGICVFILCMMKCCKQCKYK